MKKHPLVVTLALLACAKLAGAQTFIPLYSFTKGNDGATPQAGLVQASDGNLYGSTVSGSINSAGTVFRITTGGVLTPLSPFGGFNGGVNPVANLIQASDGNLYGTTANGGTNTDGLFFRINTAGTLTPLYSFTGGSDGANPHGALLQATDGNLYGTTFSGGTNGDGTVFRITTGGAITPLYSFTNGIDGANPAAGLVQASDGILYGTTMNGGTNNDGVVFRITTSGALTPLYSFTGGNDGSVPVAGLVQLSDGYLYGTTSNGTNNGGAVYRITTGGVLTSIYSFVNILFGFHPYGTLVQASDGYLYGTTAGGGTNNNGAIFRINNLGLFNALYSFTNGVDGAFPISALTLAGGNLYGTAQGGGTNGDGTVFKLALPPPPLNISPVAGGSVLFWTGSNTNYILQSTTNLASPNWTNVTNAVPIIGFTVTNSSPAQFFRLVNPDP